MNSRSGKEFQLAVPICIVKRHHRRKDQKLLELITALVRNGAKRTLDEKHRKVKNYESKAESASFCSHGKAT